ncbi:MAG: DUF5696 domain-containing protein [Clostridiales bacterium]|nr:DUF5696 domain-containing protein [Clostridiales bacterium]
MCLFFAKWGIRGESLNPPAFQGLSSISGDFGDEKNPVLNEEGDYIATLSLETLNIQIKDRKTGRVWNTVSEDPKMPAAARSPIVLKYLGKDNTFYEWDAFTYSISAKQFTAQRIKNGARITFSFAEAESFRLGEHLPTKIRIERYEESFVERLAEFEASGKIAPERARQYETALRAMYSRDEENDCYYSKFAGLPPVSVVRTLIEFAGAVEYTTEELMSDSADFGLVVEITQPASFEVSMEAVFENGTLTVNIPTYEIKSGNDFYACQNISVFPAFDSQDKDQNDGMIFVPDGAGMLFKLDTYNGVYPEYNRELYNNTLFADKYEKSSFDEELMMPVFGMYAKDSKGRQAGYMAIIKSGAELAHVAAKLKSEDSQADGALYNAVYCSADTTQYSRVKIFGPYSNDDARYLATTGLIEFDFTIAYKLYSDNASYFAFARDYRDYLIQSQNITPSYKQQPGVLVELVGAITIWDTFAGIPYHPEVSMTSFSQAAGIIDDLSQPNAVFVYKNGLNGGRMSSFPNGAKIENANGSKKELEALLAKSKPGSEVFLQADLMRVYQPGIFGSKKYYSLGYDGSFDSAVFNDQWFPDMAFGGAYDFAFYYLLHPEYLKSVTAKFLSQSGFAKNLYLTDFGNHYYGSYNPRAVTNPINAQEAVKSSLETLKSQKALALDNPNADKIGYASYALNISRESSDYGTSYATVPFRQLALNGLTQYATLDVNGALSEPKYFLLQAIELGAMPKFTVFSEKSDVLLEAMFSSYYAHEYQNIAPDIISASQEIEKAFSQIGTTEITNHEMLAPGVFETTYATGVKALVNYNLYSVTVGDASYPALDYIIRGAALNE